MEAVRSNLEQTDKAPRRNIAEHTCVGTTYYVNDLFFFLNEEDGCDRLLSQNSVFSSIKWRPLQRCSFHNIDTMMHKEEALLNFPKSCHGGNYCQDPNRAKPCLPEAN